VEFSLGGAGFYGFYLFYFLKIKKNFKERIIFGIFEIKLKFSIFNNKKNPRHQPSKKLKLFEID
jgi:hypothetical protein